MRSPVLAAVLAAVLALAQTGTAASKDFSFAAGAARIDWLDVRASPGDDWINDILALEDQTYLAVGFLNREDGDPPSDWRALAVKFSVDGRSLWTKEYGAGGGIDAFWTARERAGSLMFAGFSSRIGPRGINAYFAAADRDGLLLKENAYGGPGYDRVTGLAAAPGGFIAAGHAEGLDGRDVLLIGVDDAGVERWRRVLAESGANGALYIEPAGDGGFVVAGGTSPAGDADMLVMKIDEGGAEIWRRVIGRPGADDVNHGLVVLADGRIVAPGYAERAGADERDFMVATLTAAGDVISIETLGGAGDDRLIGAEADEEGRVWLIGHSASAGAGGADILIARIDSNGTLEAGVALLGGAQDDVGATIHPLKDGVLIGGYSRSLGTQGEDGFIARLSGLDLRAHPAFSLGRID